MKRPFFGRTEILKPIENLMAYTSSIKEGWDLLKEYHRFNYFWLSSCGQTKHRMKFRKGSRKIEN